MSGIVAKVDAKNKKEQGCTMEITCETQGMPLSEDEVSVWLANKSGLSKDYAERILVLKWWLKSNMVPPTMWASIRFDATLNCFEAMQQIRNYTVHSNDRYRQHVTNIRCQHGQFRTATLHPKDFNFLSAEEARWLLRPYGEFSTVERLKTRNGILNGRVKVVMFVPSANYRSLSECDKDRKICERIDDSAFNPATDSRVSEEFAQLMWEKYGPNNSVHEDGMRALAITKRE